MKKLFEKLVDLIFL